MSQTDDAMGEELHWLSLLEVSDRLGRRRGLAVELTRAMLARIERWRGLLHSYATLTPDQALGRRRAGRAGVPPRRAPGTAARRADRGEGPVQRGAVFRRRPGCRSCGSPSQADSTVVARLEGAGAVLLGQLQLTEGASVVHHPKFDPPRNPWNFECSTRVFLSGSGVATAAGLCFGSPGSDTAGSIRIPSFWCGLAGLKPTWGRVSRFGVFPLAETLDCIGPMARRVGDLAALLAVLAGADPSDRRPLASPGPGLPRDLADGISGVRIGVDEAYVWTGTASGVGERDARVGRCPRQARRRHCAVRIPDVLPAAEAGITILAPNARRPRRPGFPRVRTSTGRISARLSRTAGR